MARSSFYYHQKKSRLPDKYKEIKELIKAIYQRHKGRYGYRRITDELQNKVIVINHKTVMRLMKLLSLISIDTASFDIASLGQNEVIDLYYLVSS